MLSAFDRPTQPSRVRSVGRGNGGEKWRGEMEEREGEGEEEEGEDVVNLIQPLRKYC